MTRFATNAFAAIVAVMIAATSFAAVTNVPLDPQVVVVAPVLA